MLVNNAANFYAGFFEELTPEQMERQLSTSLIGPMNVTRAVLPVMRKQRSGLIITISSTAGLIGFEFGTAYAASKFGLEGWMQSLQTEVEPFGINSITVNPGFFRTELLTAESTNFAERSIEDYNERRAQQMKFWKGYNGQQSGDPAKLARALITISNKENPPRRFIAGADAVGTAEQVAATLQQQTEAYRKLSSLPRIRPSLVVSGETGSAALLDFATIGPLEGSNCALLLCSAPLSGHREVTELFRLLESGVYSWRSNVP